MTIKVAAAAFAAMVLGAGAAIAGPSPEVKCEGGKNDTSGKYAACMAKAEKTLLYTADIDAYDSAVERCGLKFAASWSRLEYPGACPTTGDGTPIQDFVDACVQSVAVAVGGGALGPDPVTCASQLAACQIDAACGDATPDAGEACDDGNAFNLDGCSDICVLEPGFDCSGSPTICDEVCMTDLIASWNFDASTVEDVIGPYDGTLTAGASYVDSYVGKGIHTPKQCSGGDKSGAKVAGFLEFAADSFTIELSHWPACSPQTWQLYSLFSKGPAYADAYLTPLNVLSETTTPYGSGNLSRVIFNITDVDSTRVGVASATTTFNCTTPHHVVAIRDRTEGEIRLFVDGVLEGELAETLGDLLPDTNVYLGGANFLGGCGWGLSAGTMDAAAFYRRALTDTEVAVLYARWQDEKLVCGL